MKQTRLLLAVMMAFVFTARAWAQTEEAYAVLSTDGETLTFYYDSMKETREGTAYPIPWEGSFPGWYSYDNPTVITVDFDDSFDNYHGLTTARYMFSGQEVLTTINHIERLHTEHVTTMYGMFAYCYKLRELDLSSFDTSNVTDMGTMFKECKELASLDVSNFNTASVTNMFYMFNACKTLKSLNLTSFNTSEVENMENMFDYCISLTTIYCNDDWSKGKVQHSGSMFDRCSQLKGAVSYEIDNEDVTYANPTTGYFTGSEAYAVYNGTDYSVTFYYDFNKSKHEDNPDEEVLDVVDHDFIRYNNISSVTIDKSFKDYHGLTSTRNMFANLPVEEIVGLANLNTENVTDMSGMFSACTRLKSLDLKTFDTGKVTNMGYMFSSCRALTTIYCYDNWQKNGLSSDYMFYGCSALIGAAAYDGTEIGASMANPDTGYFSRYDQVAIDETNFPDDNFRAWVLQQSYGQDGILTLEEANQVSEIRVPEMHIADLTGIELFPELTTLICNDNELTSLDLFHNPKVQFLGCQNNRLSSLNMAGCAPTSSFACYGNQLAGEAMDAFINSLPTLDEGTRASISFYNESVNDGNRLTTNQMHALLAKGWEIVFVLDNEYYLDHHDNRWVVITEPGQVPIAKLFFPDAVFRTWLYQQAYGKDGILTAEEIAATRIINVSLEGISDLTGLEFFSGLTNLNCKGNRDLTTLDVSPFRDLENLECHLCALTSLDVSMARSLKTLNCSINKLTSLTVGGMNGSLVQIVCNDNELTSLNVSECPELLYLNCEDNQIAGEAMDELVGSLHEVDKGYFYVVDKVYPTLERNVITLAQAAVADGKGWKVYGFDIPIDETTFPDEVFRNQIYAVFGDDGVLSPREIFYETGMHVENASEIHDITGIEYFTELNYLTCVGSQITKLDVSQNTKLLELSVEKNHLESLDVSNNPDLRFISVYGNNIHGAAMSAFVESLPTVEGGELYIWDESDDGNVITVDQVALAKAKGWAVLDRGGDDYAGVPVEKGDANGDGELTIDDAVAVANSIIGQTSVNIDAADVNNDGEVTIADATIIINNVIIADAKARLMTQIKTSEAMLDACMAKLREMGSAPDHSDLWSLASEIAANIEAVKTKAANATTQDDIDDCYDDVNAIATKLATLNERINQLEHGY